jgi:ankyrin repeat protein
MRYFVILFFFMGFLSLQSMEQKYESILFVAKDKELAFFTEYITYLSVYDSTIYSNLLASIITSPSIPYYYEKIKWLLEHGADPNQRTNEQLPLLHVVIRSNDLKLVALFLKHKADLHSRNLNGNSPLHEAVLQSNVEMVQFLLEKGASVCVLNYEGQSPYYAAGILTLHDQKNPWQIIKLCMLSGAWMPNYVTALNGNNQDNLGATALMYFAAQGDEKSVNFQLAQGTDPFIQDIYGRTVFTLVAHILSNKNNNLTLYTKEQKKYENIYNNCRRYALARMKELFCIRKKNNQNILAELPELPMACIILFLVGDPDPFK